MANSLRLGLYQVIYGYHPILAGLGRKYNEFERFSKFYDVHYYIIIKKYNDMSSASYFEILLLTISLGPNFITSLIAREVR